MDTVDFPWEEAPQNRPQSLLLKEVRNLRIADWGYLILSKIDFWLFSFFPQKKYNNLKQINSFKPFNVDKPYSNIVAVFNIKLHIQFKIEYRMANLRFLLKIPYLKNLRKKNHSHFVVHLWLLGPEQSNESCKKSTKKAKK